ncbi:MAG: hypothetical protein HY725_22140 [Candidatus Rokubacteria bacterium]|nr:hypothetical protein [Candidatus Rokubacteria bacterium]
MKRLTIRGTALSLGLFFDVSFVLCVLWGLLAPQGFTKMAGFLEVVFPGFTWLTPQSVVLGLVEAFLYGVYIAVVFVPLFNYFEGGRPAEAERPGVMTQAVRHP